MFTIVLLSALLLPSSADLVDLCNSSVQYSVRCSSDVHSEVSLPAAAGGAEGSYDVEYCVQASQNPELKPTIWALVVKYDAEVLKGSCNSTQGLKGTNWREHSSSQLALDYNLNCTGYVCFKQRLDLMFQSCYRLENRLYNNIISNLNNSYHYIENNITKEHYKKPFVHNIQLSTFLSFSWYTGLVPLTHYSIEVCEKSQGTNEDQNCRNACNNCTRVSIEGRAQLRCRLALSPLCYTLQLKHYEPWSHPTLFEELRNSFDDVCPKAADTNETPIQVSESSAWWAGGAALLLCVGALAACTARQSRLAEKARQHLRKIWLSRRQLEEEARRKLGGGEVLPRPPARVLLLYARDAAAERVVAALRAALELVAPGQVYDIFSPSVTALAGSAAHTWVCSAVRDMRVVLLQLPALRLLHEQHLSAGDAPRLREPLLARTVRRAPMFGDTLLQYALRALSDTHALHPSPYHQYYLATLSELPEDLFHNVTPFRRYELPAAISVLLRDLSPDPSPDPSHDPLPDQLHEEMAAAATELVQFVHDNRNYMEDELIMLD